MMRDQVSGVASRAMVSATTDDGPEQYQAVTAMVGESFTEVMAVRQHGLASHPPPGSHGVILSINGRRDLVVMLGGENADYRPTAQKAGGTTLYDTAGGRVVLDANGQCKITARDKVVIAVGGCTLTISADGFAFSGGRVTHDGLNIGSTHVHGGVKSGSSSTSGPG